MMEQIERIQQLNKLMLEDPNENAYTILAHTMEELGEFATAICIEDGSKVKGYKELDESSISEAIDVLICVISLYNVRGGKNKDIATILKKKLDKWQSKMQNETK